MDSCLSSRGGNSPTVVILHAKVATPRSQSLSKDPETEYCPSDLNGWERYDMKIEACSDFER